MFGRTQCILNDHEFLEGTKNRAIICALVASAFQQVADIAQFNLVYRHFEICSCLLDRPNDHLVGFITGYALAFMLDTPVGLPSATNCAALRSAYSSLVRPGLDGHALAGMAAGMSG